MHNGTCRQICARTGQRQLVAHLWYLHLYLEILTVEGERPQVERRVVLRCTMGRSNNTTPPWNSKCLMRSRSRHATSCWARVMTDYVHLLMMSLNIGARARYQRIRTARGRFAKYKAPSQVREANKLQHMW